MAGRDGLVNVGDGGGRRGRWVWWLLGVVLVVGAGLRGLYLAEVVGTPAFEFHAVDAGYHDYWARGLATGDWCVSDGQGDPLIRETVYLRPPGYAYFLSMVYRVFGCGPVWAAVVQMVLGLVNCVLVFLLGRRWFGAVAGLVAAGLMACGWVLIYYETKLHGAVVLMGLSVGMLWAFGRWVDGFGFWRGVVAGVFVGLFALVRPTILPFGVAVVLWAWWVSRRGGVGRRGLVMTVVGYAVAVMVVILPVTVRNYVVGGEFVLVSANGGINLFIGNNEKADGRFVGYLPEMGEFRTYSDFPAVMRRVERAVGREMTAGEVSGYFSGKAWGYMKEHPWRTLGLMGRKVLLWHGPKQIANSEQPEMDRARSGVLKWVPVGYSLVLGLAVVGCGWLVACRRAGGCCGDDGEKVVGDRWAFVVLVLLFLVVYSGTYLPFFVTGLYRLPTMGALVLLGGFGVSRCLAMAAGWRWGAVLVTVLGGAVACGAASVNWAGVEDDWGEWHYVRGVASEAAGLVDEAEREYRAVLAIEPGHFNAQHNLGGLLMGRGDSSGAIGFYRMALAMRPEAPDMLTNLASVLIDLKRFEEAEGLLRRAVASEPGYADAYLNLGVVCSARGDGEGAVGYYRKVLVLEPGHAVALHNLGGWLMKSGDVAGAVSCYERAIASDSGYVDAMVAVARPLVMLGRAEKAVGYLRRASELSPGRVGVWRTLGNVYMSMGELSRAIEAYERAVLISPGDASVRNNLAVALANGGRLAEAIVHAREAVRLSPDNVSARFALANMLAGAGRRDEAAAEYEKVLEIEPGFDGARRALAALEGKD